MMSTLSSLRFIGLIISVVIQPSYSSPSDDLNTFSKCDGKNTGVSGLASDTDLVAGLPKCIKLLGPAKAKYCQYRCLLVEMKLIDSSNKVNEKKLDELAARAMNEFPKRKQLVDGAKDCGRGKILDEKNYCSSTKAVIYCLRRTFNKVCNNGAPLKRRSSEERVDVEENDDDQILNLDKHLDLPLLG